jgi:hypothetical protein
MSALKIGTDAWMIDARPESIRVSPHDSSQNGIAVLTSATPRARASFSRSCRTVSPLPDHERDERRERSEPPARAAGDQASPGVSSADGDLDEQERAPPDQRQARSASPR